MNQTDSSARRSLRRLLALAGGLAIGITAILALAVPASATGGDHDKGGHKPPKTTCTPKPPHSKSPSPSPSASKSESASPSASPSAPASPSSSVPPSSPVPGAGGGGGELPVTGASIGTATGIGAVLLAAGAGLFFALRRRRIRFTA